jgi:pilus assembly protein CpaC
VLRGIKPGVTSITVSDPNRNLTTFDIHVIGDVRKLEFTLQQAFPDSTIKPIALANGVMLVGSVARATDIPTVMSLAKTFYPESVLNKLQVGGSQMIAMNVRVYEVSRSKLRKLGIDWAFSSADFAIGSSVAEIIKAFTPTPGAVPTASGSTLSFGVFSDSSQFTAFIEALERNSMAKLLDEPTLVAMNGRAAEFLSGGEIPVQVASGLGTNSIEFRPFGTKLDMVPIILGQGRIRLEIRAEVSEVATDLSGTTGVPGFRVRRVNTGVEMNAGCTLALAGDYREEVESEKQGLPGLINRPYLGQMFRRIEEDKNEIELVFLVTPTFIGEVEQYKLPVNIPGRTTQSPGDSEFYHNGYIETPQCAVDCPLPTPVGAAQSPHSVLPQQPYVPESMPEKPVDANPPVPAPSGDSPPTPPGATSDLRVPTPERKSTALTGFGYPSK